MIISPSSQISRGDSIRMGECKGSINNTIPLLDNVDSTAFLACLCIVVHMVSKVIKYKKGQFKVREGVRKMQTICSPMDVCL